MNYLQICQRLRSEAAIAGSGPSSVIGQTGESLRVVQWVAAAYEDIQNFHSTWEFLQDDVSFAVNSGVAEYTPTSAGATDLADWKKDDLRVYSAIADERLLAYVPWQNFRPYYQIGSKRTQTGKPSIVTVEPNKNALLWPIPDQAYTFDGQYYKKPDKMEGNIDEPIFMSNFHLSIVWRGLMMYGADLGAPDVYAHGRAEYKKVLRKMESRYIPEMMYGAPLA